MPGRGAGSGPLTAEWRPSLTAERLAAVFPELNEGDITDVLDTQSEEGGTVARDLLRGLGALKQLAEDVIETRIQSL